MRRRSAAMGGAGILAWAMLTTASGGCSTSSGVGSEAGAADSGSYTPCGTSAPPQGQACAVDGAQCELNYNTCGGRYDAYTCTCAGAAWSCVITIRGGDLCGEGGVSD